MVDCPVIAFGQQPCGFFPKRFLVAKIRTARRLQREIGGRIVFFFHDADHDPRETKTTLRHRRYGDALHLNFDFENKLQRKYSPLFLKRIPEGWQARTTRQIREYVPPCWLDVFTCIKAGNVADYCLEMYRAMGLLEGIHVMRSGDPEFRRAACDITGGGEFFVDVPFEGEIVRARWMDGRLALHEGGDSYVALPGEVGELARERISPTRDSRLKWMQSVVRCTHYISGAGEQAYLRREDAPEINFILRDKIDRLDEAYVDLE